MCAAPYPPGHAGPRPTADSRPTAMLQRLLRTLWSSPMQNYFLCLVTVSLFFSFVYYLAIASQSYDICSPSTLLPGNDSRTGMLLALDYSDQLTGGGMNFFCLQCVARFMDHRLRIVEPFIVGSTFGVPLDFRDPAGMTPWMAGVLRLGDVYNLTKWQSYSKEMCFARLVSWSSFLNTAPRNVVLVQHVWESCSLDKYEEDYAPFFKLFNFRVVRKVCFNFQISGALSMLQYKRSIYGNLEPANVTVIFNKWLGVNEGIGKFQLGIKDSYCVKEVIGGPLFNDLHVTPSAKLDHDVERYITQYLNKDGDNMYIAIMIRIEQVFVRTLKPASKLRLLSMCLDNVIKKWRLMKKGSSLNSTFVALDYGRYGSKGFFLHTFVDRATLQGKLRAMLQMLKQGTFQEWEDRFSEVTGTQNPGYIASLQQAVASRARCLITAGGGSFQNHAFVLHRKVYGNSCHVRLKKNCHLLDLNINMLSSLHHQN